MLDFDQMRDLELTIDRMLRVRDMVVVSLAKQADAARKKNNYAQAKVLMERAGMLYKAPRKVSEVLLRGGKASSIAQARRLIDSGAVEVDGVLCRDYRRIVTSDHSITLRGEEVHV